MKTRNIVFLVMVALVFAGVIASLIFGIATHDEPGLLRMQWLANGEARYAETQDEIDAWDEFPGWGDYELPLRVGVKSSNPYPPADPVEATRAAVSVINGRLGAEVLRVEPEDNRCTNRHAICVDVGVPHDPGFMDASGDARHEKLPTGMRCTVRTSNTGTASNLHTVLHHELGHCLGLAHDYYEASIMCGENSYNGREDCTLPIQYEGFPPEISDDDRKTLRTLLGLSDE